MLDFILGLYLAGLAVRGWIRGLVKELTDLLGLVVGVLIGFRLSAPLGDFFADRFDVTPEWARLGAGVALFIFVGIGFSILAATLGRWVRLPGLNLSNRLLGSGLAMAWGVFLILVFASILSALPLPGSVGDVIDDSVVARTVAGEESGARALFQQAAGDDVITTLLALEPLVGSQRVVLDGDDVLELPPVDPAGLELDESAPAELLEFVNRERVAVGARPLTTSQGLAEVALGHALDMYANGFVSHISPTTGRIEDRLVRAGIQLGVAGENLALAASTRAVHDGLMESPSHRDNLLRSAYDRVGIAAVRGEYGLMVVQVFGG